MLLRQFGVDERERKKEQTTEEKLSNVVFHPSYFDEVANLQRVNDDIGQDIANFLMVDKELEKKKKCVKVYILARSAGLAIGKRALRSDYLLHNTEPG